jgi:hypothetical protein
MDWQELELWFSGKPGRVAAQPGDDRKEAVLA